MTERKKEIRGRHVLAMMLGFFGVIVVVNAIFVTAALDTFGGPTTDLTYLKGLRYNDTLAAAEAQQQLGWQVDVDHQTRSDGTLAVAVTYRDRFDQAVTGLVVTAELYRPTHDDADQSATLSEMGPGRFAGELPLPLLGQWQLRVVAEGPEGPIHRREQRLWLK